MSEIFPSLLIEAHKPELLAGTSALSYGGDVDVVPASANRSADAGQFRGSFQSDVTRQLDLIQVQSKAAEELTTRFSTSAAQLDRSPPEAFGSSAEAASAAGRAFSAVVALGGSLKPGSAVPVDLASSAPALKFLSHETATLVEAPDIGGLAKSGFAAADPSLPAVLRGQETIQQNGHGLGSAEKSQEDSELRSSASNQEGSPVKAPARNLMMRSIYIDNPAYVYSAQGSGSNGVSWVDQISFSDNYNHIYPGITVNTAYDDIGGRRDAAWKLPSMHAYVSPDSGYRAGQVQNYWKDNADKIAMAIIGAPIPEERKVNLRDMLHGDIKQHHRGNQDTISKIAHLLATQDGQATTQLNNIWHFTLGRAIRSNELTDAIAQLSIGHATLSTERSDLAHSSEAAALYAQKYNEVHGHPPLGS